MSASDQTLMRALVVPENGGSDVLRVDDRPLPSPADEEVLIEVAAAGVNFIEVYQREGRYPVPVPFVLGSECAGTVRAVGSAVTDVSEGDVVATTEATGAMAQFATAKAVRVVPVPSGVAPDVAAAVMLQGMTAHYLVRSTAPVREGQAVLVHAAAGGVGQLLVQLAKAAGARVIATVGSAQKAAIARERGAEEVIRYDEVSGDDLAAAVREASGGGVHTVFDGVGRATFDASLASLRPRGMLALFGAASGPVPPVDPQRLNSGGSLFLTRPTLVHYVAGRDELLWRSSEVLGAVADGTLQVEIGGRYPLEDARRAYDDLEGRRSTGKLLVVP
jgi:NADPH2:quinone reductase